MKNKQGFAGVVALIVVVAVVVIAGGAYVLTRQEAEDPTANTNLDAPRPSEKLTAKTYDWPSQGVSFFYPESWHIQGYKDSGLLMSPNYFEIPEVWGGPLTKMAAYAWKDSLDIVVKRTIDSIDDPIIESVSIGQFGSKGTKISGILKGDRNDYTGGRFSSVVIFPGSKSPVLVIEYISETKDPDADYQTFKQIYSTLKFTQQPATSIVGWQTYKNDEYGFSFYFPEGWKTKHNYDDLSETDSMESSDYKVAVNNTGEMSYPELVSGAGMDVSIRKTSSVKSLSDMKSFNEMGNDGFSVTNQRIINVGGGQVLVSDIAFLESKGQQLEFSRNNSWVTISLIYKDSQYDKVFGQMTSTFKFGQFVDNSSFDFSKIKYTLPAASKIGGATKTFAIASDPSGSIKNGVYRSSGGTTYFFGDKIISDTSKDKGVVVMNANYGASATDVYLVLVDPPSTKQLSYVNILNNPYFATNKPYKISVTSVNLVNNGAVVSVGTAMRYGNNFEGTNKFETLNYQVKDNQLVPLTQ